MGVTVAIGSGLAILTMLLFVYILVDCIRRSEADFPALIYGGKEISQRVVKGIWTWILILSFILGLSASQQIWSQEATETKSLPPGTLSYKSEYWFYSPFFTYRVNQVDDKETRESALRIPLLLFLGVYVYYRGVKKQHREQERSS
jgi:hypothetical protein